MENNEIIKEYITTRGLKKTSYKTYKVVLNHYSKHQKLTLQKLIQEAEQEETQQIRWKHRKLKTRLIQYTNYCKTIMKITSVKIYIHIVKSFYHHHEIEIGKLPPLNLKNSITSDPITYYDLPDKEIIRQAIEISNPLMRGLILFLATTGMSKVDALNLKISDFITSTGLTGNIEEVIEEALQQDNIIPMFKARRKKTNKYFITFCTPETTKEICLYLKNRNKKKQLQEQDQLFEISNHWYTIKFQQINETLQLGKVGSYNRFRGHMLRKFHASNLEKAGMDRTMINTLQGKSNGAVDDVYFFHDEEVLKKEYIRCMPELLINVDVNEVNVYSKEYLEILNKNKELELQVKKIDSLEEEIADLKSWYIF